MPVPPTSIWIASIVGLLTQATAQVPESQAVFQKVSPSVFQVEMRGKDGTTVATGTAFLISERRFLTNAHVVSDGTCHIRVGPARLSCKVVQTDAQRDLALLEVEGELVASPLVFAKATPAIGSPVYVVSNPLGMERTISQGLYSGNRTVGTEELMQLSAPVSSGSSGGPVVAANATVVGVVVGTRKDGQLVNFAVPATTVSAFLAGTLDLDSYAGVRARLDALQTAQFKLEYSNVAGSPWQRNEAEQKNLLARGLEVARSEDELIDLVDFGRYLDSAIALTAARRAANGKVPSGRGSLTYADLLRSHSQVPETTGPDKSRLLSEALIHAQRAVVLLKQNEASLVMLGEVHVARQELNQAYETFKRAAGTTTTPDFRTLENLCLTALDLRLRDDAKRWLDKILESKASWAVSLLASDLKTRGEYEMAARGFDRAAQTAIEGAIAAASNWCRAAAAWWTASNADEALGSARACLKDGQAHVQTNARLKQYVGNAHRIMADIFITRGLNDEALIAARQGVDLNGNAWAYATLADALRRNKRLLEAVDAAKTALRMADGKYGFMHFRLAAAYFDLERWEDAAASFKMAATIDTDDASAAYNVGLSYYNAKFRSDAIMWLEQTLRRNPEPALKQKAERLLAVIR